MNMSVFKDKVTVITGAGSGIGRALARQLSDAGAHLALGDKDDAGLKATFALLSSVTDVTSYKIDVCDRNAYQVFVKQVITDHKHVDIVINNAGIVRLHSITQSTYEDYEKTLNVNFWGVLYGCKEFLPYLKQRPRAWLANMSSGAGIIGLTNYSSYNASKFAVRGLTESLRNELRDTNITVSCIHPGGVRTNIHKSGVFSPDSEESYKKLGKLIEGMSVEKAAKIILNGMAKGKKRILVGNDLKLADLIVRLMPNNYEDLISWIGRNRW